MAGAERGIPHRAGSSQGAPAPARLPGREGAGSRGLLGFCIGAAAYFAGKTPAAGASPEVSPSAHGRQEPAAQAAHAAPSQEEKWRRRFPQPVLVSDLIGRKMLDPAQGTLGRIETLVTDANGEILIVFARRRFFIFDGEAVAIPAKTAALLGHFVVVLDLSPEHIESLPVFSANGTKPLDSASRILMALTKH